MNIKELQKQVIEVKKELSFFPKNRDCKTDDIKTEFLLMYGELAESYNAFSKNKPDLYEELADVAIYLLSICEMTGCDLEAAIIEKLEIVKKRHYKYKNGAWFKDNEKYDAEEGTE